ncbi:ABC transporter, putative [Leishmania donovani]|uniref:ABC transporter, putative n=1 Tax=Leishmania donovani TaxID=5661 RepID=A0A3Q8IBV9_LEIDO|nr:ABC transporter, putative [Leishmania donovani]
MSTYQPLSTVIVSCGSSSSSNGDGVSEAAPHHHRQRDSVASTVAEHADDGINGALHIVSTTDPHSGRLRTRHRRRCNAGHSAGDLENPLRGVSTTYLTLCCDSVSVQLNARDVIDDVSCLFRGGRVTAVVNCCGTHSAFALLAVMAGRVESTAGNTVLNGIPVSASTYQAQVSFLEDVGEVADKEEESGSRITRASGGLFAELTVRENLQYASALRVANSAQAYSVDEVLQQLLLGPHEASKIKNCSLYVRRRVALGKELLLNPSVLLLDEPLEGLATHESQQYLTILSKLAAPSAADAEARRVMREAMCAAAATAAGECGVSACTAANLAANPHAADVLLYTPRHSRLHSGAQASPSTPADMLLTPATTAAATFADPASCAEAQRIVVLSMVQPRWALLQHVHDVVLLERNRCVFAGSVQDMLAVKLPKGVMRENMAASASGDGELTDETGTLTTGTAAAATSTPRRNPLMAALVDSYDAVDASIQQQRLGEQTVHGLYRLAASMTTPAAGGDGSESGEGGAAATSESEFRPIINVESFSDGQASRPSSVAASASFSPYTGTNADGLSVTPLSQLYAHRQQRTRAKVTAYMEACAMGLVDMPEAFHQPPSSIVQLLHLFHFGFLELRHNLLWDVFSLVCGLTLAAALAALYGRQAGQDGMQNRVGIIFFLVSCVVLQAVLSLDTLRREYAAFQHYSFRGYYGACTYLVFCAITAALWRFGLASFVALAVFVLSNFGEPWHEYRGVFELSVILAVTSFCSHFGVWFLCAWLPSDHVGRFVIFTFYTLNIILAGLVLNLQTLPETVQAISFMSVVRLAYESCILTQFIGKSFGCHDNDTAEANGTWPRVSVIPPSSSAAHQGCIAAPTAEYAGACRHARASTLFMRGMFGARAAVYTNTCYTGTEYAEFLGFSPSRRWSNVGVLVGMSALLLAGSWIMMTLYRPRRRLKMSA